MWSYYSKIAPIPTEELRAILKSKADQFVQLTAQIDFTEQHLRIVQPDRRADIETKLEEIKRIIYNKSYQ